jgi:hypothetical protein
MRVSRVAGVGLAPLSFSLLSFACLSLVLLGCGGGATIQHHPVGEIGARAEARVELVALVVKDRARAARVRELYLRVAELERRFVKTRNAAWLAGVQSGPSPDLAVVAKHVEKAATEAYHEYARLMLAVRAEVTEREFARLNAIR